MPYISWKGNTTRGAVPGWSRPYTNNIPSENPGEVSFGNPRPIKHWRKQLTPRGMSGESKSAYSITSNIPGSTVHINNDQSCCNADGQNGGVVQFDIPINNTSSANNYTDGINNVKKCISCDPASKIIRSGMANKHINPININNKLTFKTYSFNQKQYLESKCKTYNQNLTGSPIPGITYATRSGCCAVPTPYNDSDTGPQNRESLTCSTNTCHNNKLRIIIKPNNQQYFQQGAVSSSSRIDRLKYNTVSSNAQSFKSAWGAQAANAGRYRADGNSPYFIKNKNNVCTNNIYHRKGNSTMCS